MVPKFTSSRGNEYFCEIDEDYLTDRFNLTGINVDVQYYQYALDLVTDVFELDCDDDMREQIEKSARHLYGLVHARYITTTRGLTKMVCLVLLSPLVPPATNDPLTTFLRMTAREIQKRRLWKMPSRYVFLPPPPPHRPIRQCPHTIRETLLRQMRRSV